MSHLTRKSKSPLLVAAVARRSAMVTFAGALLSGALLFPALATAAPDPDQDGLTTTQEEQVGTDPYRYDTDMDGLSDFQEIVEIKTNPVKADTDGDGVSDGQEVANKTDPGKQTGPAVPPPPPVNRVAVNADVDVYDAPGGNGNIIGVQEGENDTARFWVQLFSCQEDNWCQIGFGAGPGGRGWVWGDFLDRVA